MQNKSYSIKRKIVEEIEVKFHAEEEKKLSLYSLILIMKLMDFLLQLCLY